jgi:hypothetical protein
MLGTNDPGNPNNIEDLIAIVDSLEAQHIVPILSTIPPRNDAFSDELNVEFNSAVAALAQSRSLPLIDFYREILLRRPGTTWIGTLISADASIRPRAAPDTRRPAIPTWREATRRRTRPGRPWTTSAICCGAG